MLIPSQITHLIEQWTVPVNFDEVERIIILIGNKIPKAWRGGYLGDCQREKVGRPPDH